MLDFITGLFSGGGLMGYLEIALSVVGLFALIATKTPNQTDDKIVQIFMDIINSLGANLGQAKNQ